MGWYPTVPTKELIEARSCPEPNTGCWLWTYGHDVHGYGILSVGSRNRKASRISYEVFIGPIASGLLVRHKCDTRACVNPRHLELGTPAENSNDMRTRGRAARGEGHGMAKLTNEAVLAIRADTTSSQRALARRFGVSKPVISGVQKRIGWRHI